MRIDFSAAVPAEYSAGTAFYRQLSAAELRDDYE